MFIIIWIIAFNPLFAQDPPPPPPPEEGVPIDQNLHYLLLVGLVFGLYWAFRQIKSHRSRD
ncbi:MAG: hypothetical protein EBT51_06875 [Flavobacteriaceae bacterium]|nr:hypothetical protein [Flavobacteriaceae bacterium]